MLHLTHPLPDYFSFNLAVSGGIDSVCALHWLHRRGPKSIIYVHHNTGNYADDAHEFVKDLASKYDIPFNPLYIKDKPPTGDSKEAWWREQRYKLFAQHNLNSYPIVLGHHLDDCVEQYIIATVLRPKFNKIIPYYGMSNTIRPFRTWKKQEIIQYSIQHNLTYLNDPSNEDNKYLRNYVRNELLPMILIMNPGIYKQVKREIMKDIFALQE